MSAAEPEAADRLARRRAWINSLFVDHAALRLGWRNWAAVEDGRLYRSNHPLPWQLRQAAEKLVLALSLTRASLRAPYVSPRPPLLV